MNATHCRLFPKSGLCALDVLRATVPEPDCRVCRRYNIVRASAGLGLSHSARARVGASHKHLGYLGRPLCPFPTQQTEWQDGEVEDKTQHEEVLAVGESISWTEWSAV